VDARRAVAAERGDLLEELCDARGVPRERRHALVDEHEVADAAARVGEEAHRADVVGRALARAPGRVGRRDEARVRAERNDRRAVPARAPAVSGWMKRKRE
jgi:hypothetical protein